MKSLVVIEHEEIFSRRIVKGDILTVGNCTCDIPIPGEDRILFAIDIRSDEEFAHIYMHERIPLQVNTKRYEQGLIDVEPSSIIHIREGIQMLYILDENIPEKEDSEITIEDATIEENPFDENSHPRKGDEQQEQKRMHEKTILEYFQKAQQANLKTKELQRVEERHK